MTFISFGYLCFLGVLFATYFIIPRRLQTGWLLMFSLLFCYLAGGKRMLFFLGVSTVTTWLAALALEKPLPAGGKRLVLLGTLILNFSILAAFKYLGFLVENVNLLAHLCRKETSWKALAWAAPLGISFYTFQVTGYLLDVSRGTCQAEKSFLRYALFASFFPQMVTGPINRYRDMAGTLYQEKGFNYTRVTFGIQRIAWGFFKKLVISERLAVIVNTIYGDPGTYRGMYIGFGTLIFVLQLYTDFSGSMDIALGSAEVLGVKMAENFDTPLFSRSIAEFWRRWHMTLGGWMRDYIFYPLLKSDVFVAIGDKARKYFGKKKGKKVPSYLALFYLWFMVGVWHGGAWKYVIGSGVLYGFYIIMGEVTEPYMRRVLKFLKINTDCFSWRLFQNLRTIFLYGIGALFFRANSFRTALSMLRVSVYPNIWIFTDGSLFRLGLDVPDFIVGLIGLGILLLVSSLQMKFHAEGTGVRVKLAEQNLIFRWLIYYALIFSVIIFGFYGPGYDPSEFIYQNF